jgi:uncharacterized protein YfaP (DUF2135 family)
MDFATQMVADLNRLMEQYQPMLREVQRVAAEVERAQRMAQAAIPRWVFAEIERTQRMMNAALPPGFFEMVERVNREAEQLAEIVRRTRREPARWVPVPIEQERFTPRWGFDDEEQSVEGESPAGESRRRIGFNEYPDGDTKPNPPENDPDRRIGFHPYGTDG